MVKFFFPFEGDKFSMWTDCIARYDISLKNLACLIFCARASKIISLYHLQFENHRFQNLIVSAGGPKLPTTRALRQVAGMSL